MHVRRSPIAAAIALCLFSLPALAADPQPADLLKQAEAERKPYLETVKELVAIDTGTGQEKGLTTVSGMLVKRLEGLGAGVTTTPATPSPRRRSRSRNAAASSPR